jgi:hypothetical protein
MNSAALRAKEASEIAIGLFVIALCYSTVTDLARLRGWSTSVPMKTAV